MITNNHDHMYELLPAYIRAQDTARGYPLRALMRIMWRQGQGLEDNLATLYDDWFIETCQEWVVPYIGDLIGYEAIEDLRDVGSGRSAARDRVLIPRREIANTLRYRARKGTLALLEALAMDVGGWTAAAAVEFFGSKTKYPDPDDEIRRIIGEIFEKAIPSDAEPKKTHIRLFVWRKRVYPITRTIPNYVENKQPNYYSFSPIGHDVALYTRPGERDVAADARNLPMPITIERLTKHLTDYYGEGKSICLYAPQWPPVPNTGKRGVPPPEEAYHAIHSDNIVVGNLDDANIRRGNRPNYPVVGENMIVIDPERGRILFPARPRQRARQELRVSYYTGFNADLGGGEYERPLSQHPAAKVIPTPCTNLRVKIDEALEYLANTENPTQHVLIEITDSGVFSGSLPDIELKAGQTLQIRAANRKRPVIWIQDRATGAPDCLRVLPYPESCFILDGVLLAGRGIHFEEPLSGIYRQQPQNAHVILRHSTLVPGWLLEPDTQPIKSEGTSIELSNVLVTLTIQRSIVGTITVLQEDSQWVEASEIVLEDSIVDSTANADEPAIYSYRDNQRVYPAYVALTARRSTIIGEVDVQELPLAENSIFYNRLDVANRQGGMMRYCYVPTSNSNTPARFRCEPDLHNDAKVDFLSQRYGTADYCELDETNSKRILDGAEFGGEMGVYNHLYNNVRRANLEKRLREYLPVGIEDVQILFTADNIG